MLSLENISFRKRNELILQPLSGTVERGNSITIFGPNGAGKSTLMQIMAGLLKPTKGKRKTSFVRKNPIGYVPQQLALFDGLTVKDHLRFYQKLTKQRDEAFVQEMIDVLNLNEIMNKRIEKLSGGMKRKVNLAVGIIHQPEIIFLDEAFVGVDLAAKFDMLNWLKQLNERGTTIVFITHDWHVIHALAKEMWLLDEGVFIDHIQMDEIDTFKNKNKLSIPLQKMFDANRT